MKRRYSTERSNCNTQGSCRNHTNIRPPLLLWRIPGLSIVAKCLEEPRGEQLKLLHRPRGVPRSLEEEGCAEDGPSRLHIPRWLCNCRAQQRSWLMQLLISTHLQVQELMIRACRFRRPVPCSISSYQEGYFGLARRDPGGDAAVGCCIEMMTVAAWVYCLEVGNKTKRAGRHLGTIVIPGFVFVRPGPMTAVKLEAFFAPPCPLLPGRWFCNFWQLSTLHSPPPTLHTAYVSTRYPLGIA